MQHDAPDHFAVTQHNIIIFTPVGPVVAAGWFENQIHQEEFITSCDGTYLVTKNWRTERIAVAHKPGKH